jgi:hypothetical protein
MGRIGVLHTNGSGGEVRGADDLSALYDELRAADAEHGEVSVMNEEAGWGISAHLGGRVILESLVEPGQGRHMKPVTKNKVLELWRLLIEGDLDALNCEPWKPGYHDPSERMS